MRFDLSDEQMEIDESLSDMLAARVSPARLRHHIDAGADDLGLWDELRGNGWCGTAIPEQFGGHGLGLLELGLVCERLGTTLAPVPLLSTVAAALVIETAGSEHQRERLLPGLATGDVRGALGIAASGIARVMPDALGAGVRVVVDGETGEACLVDAEPVPIRSIDLTRRLGQQTLGPNPDSLPGDGNPGVDRAEVLAAAELTGVAQRALDLAVAYARERHQFGRPIGSFQGVSHRCAEMLVATESARSLWRYAASVADASGDELALAASTAKIAATEAAWRATSGAMQIHGGIGFTWEHEVHLLLRRARVGRVFWFGLGRHRRRVAALAHEETRRRMSLMI